AGRGFAHHQLGGVGGAGARGVRRQNVHRHDAGRAAISQGSIRMDRVKARGAGVAPSAVLPILSVVLWLVYPSPVFADLAIVAQDASGKAVDMTRSHASIERTPPERAESAPTASTDPDALRYILSGPAGEMPRGVRVVSLEPSGTKLD